jgi:hypothetical protein
MYHALIEARIPFELMHEGLLTPDRLDSFKLLILADTAALSDAQCDAIRAYVKRGGSVLATFATSLYDEFGRRRQDFGLADTPRIINGVFKVAVRPTTSFPSPMTLIPTYPDLPMEDVYPRVAHTDTRELYLRDLARAAERA